MTNIVNNKKYIGIGIDRGSISKVLSNKYKGFKTVKGYEVTNNKW